MARIRKKTNISNENSVVWKTALYIRLSREDGNDVSLSVINQKQRLMAYVESYRDELQLVDTYIDDGYTGTDSNREGFQRMLTDIRNKNVNCVIVKDVSRLSRNYIEAGQYMEQLFVAYDVRFISLELPAIDSYKAPDQMNSIIIPIQNVINDDFCRQTSIKIRGVFNIKRSKGEFIGSFAPYGYLKDPADGHRLIIDDYAAQVIRDIYAWFVNEGLSKIGIARRLNSLGISNPALYKKQGGYNFNNPRTKQNDGMWSTSTITTILQNLTYLGHMVQGRHRIKSYKVHTQVKVPKEEWYIVENTHEPIISREVFDKAQSLQERDTRTAPSKGTLYLFSGFIRCADCDKAMTRRTSKNYTYYACRTYTEKSNIKCTRHSIRADKLERILLVIIQKQIELVGNLSEIISELNKTPILKAKSTRLTQALKQRERELIKVTGITDSLYTDWKNGDISREEYHRLKSKFEEQSGHIKQQAEQLRQEIAEMESCKSQQDPYLENFLKKSNIDSLNRGILSELVRIIYVHEGGEISIEFTFSDRLK